jgi:para-aminobenzoate synthetase/4-amino-4-deoxychorismate lyase
MRPSGRNDKHRLMTGLEGPFVVLDDARPDGALPARLYRNPVGIIEARAPEDVSPALQRIREAAAAGLYAAGFLAYEAGYALERKLTSLVSVSAPGAPPLVWFGLFQDEEQLDQQALSALLPHPASAWTGTPQPLIRREQHRQAVLRTKAHIEAGDIYQANLTFPCEVPVAGSPAGLYSAIRTRALAPHGAFLFTGTHWILSFSPELFFSIEQHRITTRPMKGTAARSSDPAADIKAAHRLQEDPKQRAENLMIVDLLRNDLARVSKTGSVRVPSLFAVETYPTVHQMTSTVTSELEEGRDAVSLLEAIFPCGSVTGAPKIRAMEIIAELEGGPRGIYTGSIGVIEPEGDATFNVAIRTLVLREGARNASLGLGSGIVADSVPEEEWRECLAKGRFVADGGSMFDLIETMRFDPHEGLINLDRHLARMKQSAVALGFEFDRHGARNELQAATFRLREPRKIRLRLSRFGRIALEGRPLSPLDEDQVAVSLLPLPVDAADFRLRHKTSDRAFYDEARRASGCAEVLFHDKEGFVTEGSFTNVFVEREGMLLTPPLRRGLLPGILRACLIEGGEAMEADLTAADLADGFYVGNAVRGLKRAILVG